MKIYNCLALSLLMFASCTTTKELTRADNYPAMYSEKPSGILIMPPINKTVNVEAKEYFYTSLAKPLCNKGYYVVSPFLAMEILKSESAYDSEMFLEANLAPFRNVFGAEAALFTIINNWEKSTIGSKITVNIEYILKSTKNNEIIFNRKGKVTVDTSINISEGGLLGSLISMAASAVNTAITDKVVAARCCNEHCLYDLPEGQYSPKFGLDGDIVAGAKEFEAAIQK
ncbi:MAG: DUF799 family lipoprotein [Bacteroides sp.]